MKYFPSCLLMLISITTGSCATNTGTGMFAGGVLGGGIGGLTSGSGGGILIGTAVGVVAGGLIGFVLDEQDRKVMERSSPRTVDRMDRGEPLTINDVIKLSQGGVSDDTIIEYMGDTNSTYHLSQAQIRRLNDAGVSKRVIETMANSDKGS
ncbi:MAG: glycine zipper domain-containing protein [Chlamydiota bacterium]